MCFYFFACLVIFYWLSGNSYVTLVASWICFTLKMSLSFILGLVHGCSSDVSLCFMKYSQTILFCPFLKHHFWNYFVLVPANYFVSVGLRTDSHKIHSHLCSIQILFLHSSGWSDWSPALAQAGSRPFLSFCDVFLEDLRQVLSCSHWVSSLLLVLHPQLQLHVCVMIWTPTPPVTECLLIFIIFKEHFFKCRPVFILSNF